MPGPQLPLYVLGRELKDLFPVAFLPENHALAIAIMSYNGNLDYGLLGDYDAMPDIDVVADGIEQSLAALLAVVRRRAGAGPSRREPSAGSDADAGPARRPGGRAPASGRTGPGPAPAPAPAPIVPADRSRMRGPAADMRAKREQAKQRSRSQPRKP